MFRRQPPALPENRGEDICIGRRDISPLEVVGIQVGPEHGEVEVQRCGEVDAAALEEIQHCSTGP